MTETTETYITVEAVQALDTFVGVWSQGLSADIAPALTCTEVDALADLLAAAGRSDAAEAWIDTHRASDEEGDRHYQAPVTEYIVPIDPMDDLQCDSCQ